VHSVRWVEMMLQMANESWEGLCAAFFLLCIVLSPGSLIDEYVFGLRYYRNVQTTAGVVAVGDMNKGQSGKGAYANQGAVPPSWFTNDHDSTTFFGSRKGKCVMGCILFWLVSLAVLLGVLYPRMPNVVIRRTQTIDTLHIYNTSQGHQITGEVILDFTNINYYPISVKSFTFTGLVGSATNNVSFSSSVGDYTFPAQVTVNVTAPVNTTIPLSVDIVALTDCNFLHFFSVDVSPNNQRLF